VGVICTHTCLDVCVE